MNCVNPRPAQAVGHAVVDFDGSKPSGKTVYVNDNAWAMSDVPFARHAVFPVVSRPRVLSAVVVAGMIVAGFSFIAGLVSAGYGAAVYMNSNAARDRLLRNAPADLPVSTPTQPVLLMTPLATPVGPHGMDAAARSATVEAVNQRIEMTPQQALQLDALLAQDGDEIFSLNPGDAISPPAIIQQLGDRVGRLPSADGSEPFYFETATGRAEVYENRALFYRQHALTPVRAVAGRRTNASGHPILLPADVTAVIQLVQDACERDGAKPLGDAQVQALRALLSDPQQQLVSEIPGPDGNQLGINGASVRPDGYARIDFSGGALLLGPAGNVVLRSDRAAIPVVSSAACGLVILEGLVSLGMAVFLLIICLGLFRVPRRRTRPLELWSISKIALSLLGGLAMAWMIESYWRNSTTPSQAAAHSGWSAMLLGIIVAVLGCAYPLAVLIIARSRKVREYFEPTA